jgi:hypothetical protein
VTLGFVVPAFLAALAALAIPLAVHLRQRDRGTPFRFPSLMFLERLPIRTSERRRVTDLPLLLLRALALALLALAFARPAVRRSAAADGTGRARAVVLLLDRSQSMGHADVWPAALDSARAVVNALGADDRVAVVRFDDGIEVAHPLGGDRAAALAAVGATTPMPRGTRLAPALRAARQLLAAVPDAAGEVVIVSDLQRSAVAGVAGLELPASVTLRAIPVAPPTRANRAIVGVEARRLASGDRSLLAVQARVVAHELPADDSIRLSLAVNGRETATRTATLPRDGERVVAFDPIPAPLGAIRGRLALGADRLAADDTFHFAVPTDDVLRVPLLVPDDAARDETLFLERALAIGKGPEVRVERLRAAGFDGRAARDAGVVVLWDVEPAAAQLAILRGATARGAGVVTVAGRRLGAGARAASAVRPARIAGTSDRLADRGGSFGDVRFEHPLFTPFRDAPAALTSARFLRYPRLEPEAGAEVLARFDDGQPAVLERLGEAGRLLVVATPLDARTGDFPLQPAFLPFLRRLVLHASGREATSLWRTTGDGWAIPDGIADVVVQAPDGALIRPGADSARRAIPLADAGVYAAFAEEVSGEPAALVAVNVPAGESDLTPVDPTELLLGVATTTDSTARAGEGPLPLAEVEKRQGLWRWLVAAALLLLVAETVVASRGWRGIASRIRPVSPDRSAP